jgi:hypothetical protein
VPSSVADEVKVEAPIASNTATIQVRALLWIQNFGIPRSGKESVLHVFPVLVLVGDVVNRVTL